MREIVLRCGFNRSMALAVRYTPRKLGGAGFRRLYHEWGVLPTMEMIKNLQTIGSIQQTMTLIGLSWCQHYIGMSTFFLEETLGRIPPCPNGYYMTIREFLSEFEGKLRLSKNVFLPGLRTNIRDIMDLAIALPYSDDRINSINACRQYLQATALSNIADGRGTHIINECWMGDRVVTPSTYTGELFNQQKPSSVAWGIWQTFLRTLCRRGKELRLHLGLWTRDSRKLRHFRGWVYNPDTDTLFKKTADDKYVSC